MSCYHCATGCQCGDILRKVLKHKLNTCSHPPSLPSPPPVIHCFISRPGSPVSEWAAQVGCQGGWVPTAPGSDWSRSPWGTLPSSQPPVKPQLPARQIITNYIKMKRNKKLDNLKV